MHRPWKKISSFGKRGWGRCNQPTCFFASISASHASATTGAPPGPGAGASWGTPAAAAPARSCSLSRSSADSAVRSEARAASREPLAALSCGVRSRGGASYVVRAYMWLRAPIAARLLPCAPGPVQQVDKTPTRGLSNTKQRQAPGTRHAPHLRLHRTQPAPQLRHRPLLGLHRGIRRAPQRPALHRRQLACKVAKGGASWKTVTHSITFDIHQRNQGHHALNARSKELPETCTRPGAAFGAAPCPCDEPVVMP